MVVKYVAKTISTTQYNDYKIWIFFFTTNQIYASKLNADFK